MPSIRNPNRTKKSNRKAVIIANVVVFLLITSFVVAGLLLIAFVKE